jgi:hypothetical protein
MCNQEVFMSNYVRAQVLLEPSQHRTLARIAEQEGRSISELVREMVTQQLRERVYREMEAAARRLAEDYAPGGELTDLTNLDAEEFVDV